MSCKQCIHYNACKFTYIEAFGSFNEEQFGQTGCAEFQDKSRYIELPCAVGDTVYMFDEQYKEIGKADIYEGEIISFSFQNDGLWFYCRYKCGLTYWHKIEDFGKIVFTEKALERSEGE